MSESELLSGRPYGGCAIVYKRSAKISVSPIEVSCNSGRCQACELVVHTKNGDTQIIVFNVYMPCDGDDVQMYTDILASIEAVLMSHSEVNNVILAGDFNTDFSRTCSRYTGILRDFCEQYDLLPCVLSSVNNVDFTYVSDVTNNKSVLDHFIVSDNLFVNVRRYYSIKDGDNVSDHFPVILESCLQLLQNNHVDAHLTEKLNWKSASFDDLNRYKIRLKSELANISMPIEAILCGDVGCLEHIRVIDQYHDDIVNACVKASVNTIPKKRKRKRLAGWSESVKALKEKSIFWTHIWRANGCPSSGIVKDIMKSAKKAYKREARYIRRNQDRLIADNIAKALRLTNRSRFWQLVKGPNAKGRSVPTMIDGAYGDIE